MGKPAGGSRPIALMPMPYRLYTKIRRPHIIKWELAHQRPWDAAVKGSSALRAGLLSLLRGELAMRLGKDSLVTLWDMEKFYDNIVIETLIEIYGFDIYPRTLATQHADRFGYMWCFGCTRL